MLRDCWLYMVMLMNHTAAATMIMPTIVDVQLHIVDDDGIELPQYHLAPGAHLLRHNLTDQPHRLAVAGAAGGARQQLFNMEAGGLDPLLIARSGMERSLVLALFIPLVLIGLLGNVWVISSVARVLSHQWFPINLLFRQISLYIMTLAIVDLTMVLSIPMLVTYTLSGNWPFGQLGCKLFFMVENINKLLSVMILASMSVERFIAVVRPLQWLGIRFSQKRMNSAFTLLGFLLATVAVLCTPMIYFAQANHYMLIFPDESVELEEATCGSQLPDRILPLFIAYMLLFGFVVPLPLIAVCYFFIIRHIQRKPQGTVSSYTARAVRSILRVVVFHFICWTPFWVAVLLPLLSQMDLLHMESLLDSKTARLFRMVTSFLPYLNCSLNWIFYGIMNRQLRETGTITGRRGCMPLRTMPYRTASTSVASKRSNRSLIASSRV